jgi:DNA recombination protein RmuC
LDRAVQAYNETVGSFEHRVIVQARRFKDLGVAAKEDIPDVNWIDRTARQLERRDLPEHAEKEELAV